VHEIAGKEDRSIGTGSTGADSMEERGFDGVSLQGDIGRL
jgi:hypothetical protein